MQKTSIKQFFLKYRLPLLSGVLVGTSYIPFPPWAILFAYTPLWFFILNSAQSKKEVFLSSWISQFVLTLIGFHWIIYTAMEFGHLPISLSIGALLLFALLAHLYIPLSLLTADILRRKLNLPKSSAFFLFALTQGLFERAWPSIFPWNLGYTLYYGHLPMAQLADLIGFNGLTLVVLLLNAWVGFIVIKYLEIQKSWKSHAAGLVSVFIILNALGYGNQLRLKKPDKNIKAGIIQANIGNQEKLVAEMGAQNYQEFILDKHIRLTNDFLKSHPETELLIWPESAIPARLDPENSLYPVVAKLKNQIAKWNIPLITGGLSRYTPPKSQRSFLYNAFFIFTPQNPKPLIYRKSVLLAFGEYLPFGETFPWLYKLLPFVSDFGKGEGPEILNLKTEKLSLSFGPQICYEGLFPDFSQELSKNGAQILVNLTNDSWFTPPFGRFFQFEPLQHLYMTAARTIELRTPLIRSTNTGISTVIDPLGRFYQESPTLKEWSSSFFIPYFQNIEPTFYAQWGHWDWVLWLLIILYLLTSAYQKIKPEPK